MVTEFKVGHKYRWIGPASYNKNWNSDMDKWKDGTTRTCTRQYSGRATFTKIDGGPWYYRDCIQYFIEVKNEQLELEFEYDN